MPRNSLAFAGDGRRNRQNAPWGSLSGRSVLCDLDKRAESWLEGVAHGLAKQIEADWPSMAGQLPGV